MTDFLLYHDNSSPTGPALARALGIECGKTLERKVESLIRWGNRMQIPREPGRVLNKMTAMNNASNKERAFRVMQENDVPHPQTVTRFDGELLVARKPSHQHGSGMYLVTSQRDFDRARQVGCNHFMKYIPCKREFRCHIFRGELIFAYKRVLPRDPGSLTVRNDWNEERIDSPPQNIVDASKRAVDAMGLDFGAVDIVLSESDRPYVLEVNTAAGLMKTDTEKKPSFSVYERKIREWLDE